MATKPRWQGKIPGAPAPTGGIFVRNVRGEVVNPAALAQQNLYLAEASRFDPVEPLTYGLARAEQIRPTPAPAANTTGLPAFDGLSKFSLGNASGGNAAPTDAELSASPATAAGLNFKTAAVAGVALLAAVWFFKRKG